MALNLDVLKQIVQNAEACHEGDTADYIPELANVDKNITAIAVHPLQETPLIYSNVLAPNPQIRCLTLVQLHFAHVSLV